MATELPSRPGRRRLIIGGAFALALIVVIGVVVSTLGASAERPAGSSGDVTTTSPSSRGAHTRTGTLDVAQVSPADGATNVAYNSDIVLTFSRPLRANAHLPTLNPPLAGRWSQPTPTTLRFVPSSQMIPARTEHIVVPEGSAGPGAKNGARLASAFTSSFTVVPGTTLRIQELLAELDYLPYSFAPAGSGPATTRAAGALGAEATDSGQVSRQALPGTFVPRFTSIPDQLAAQFTAGQDNVVTTGAVMRFESDHNLPVDGEIGPAVWENLLDAVASRDVTTQPYDYLIVTETNPETLYVWRDGTVIYQTPANTGAPGAATQLGTFPVYLRFTSATMKGTNPDGSHYVDPGIPWIAYFNGNDAVHGFVRPGYGYPQSDGCVELPIANAAKVFPTDPLGTLVTVTTGELSTELHAAPPTFISPPPAPTTTTAPASTTTTTTTPPAHHPAPTTTTAPATTLPATTLPATTVPPTTVPASPTTTTVPAPSGPSG